MSELLALQSLEDIDDSDTGRGSWISIVCDGPNSGLSIACP